MLLWNTYLKALCQLIMKKKTNNKVCPLKVLQAGQRREPWALVLTVNEHPTLYYAPHCSRQEKVLWCTRHITSHKTQYVQVTPQMTPARETIDRTNMEGSESRPESPPTLWRDTQTLRRMLTLCPTLCLQKSPPGPERCQPRPLWACLWPCSLCGGKRRLVFKTEKNHTLLSPSYKTTSPGNSLKVS